MYKFISYIKMPWPFQRKFQINIFGVMTLQMKQKTWFWEMLPCTLKDVRKIVQTSGLRMQKIIPK